MPGIANNSGESWGDLAPPSWGGAEGFNAIPLTGWEGVPQESSGVKAERKSAPVKKVDPPTPEEIQKAETEIARIEKIIIAGRQKSAKHRERLSALDEIRKSCREEIEPLRSDMDEIKAEKSQIIAKKDEIAPRKEGGGPNRKQARDSVPFTSMRELNQAIADQEFDLGHTSFSSLREEKEAVANLKKLKGYAPAVAAYEKEFGVKPEVEEAMKMTRDQLKPLNARFDELKAIADGKFKKLNELRDKITVVNEEADGIRKVMAEENAALDKEFEKIKAFRGKHGGMVADFFKRIADINSGKVALSEAHRVAQREREAKEEAKTAAAAKKKAAADAIIAAQAAAKEAHAAANAPVAKAGGANAAAPAKKEKASKKQPAEEASFSLQTAGKPVVQEAAKALTAEERRAESILAHQRHLERLEKAEQSKKEKAEKLARAAARREAEQKVKREKEAKEAAIKEKNELARRKRKEEAKALSKANQEATTTRAVNPLRKKKTNSVLPKFVQDNQTAFIACACLAALSLALVVLVKL